jgi:hypothetical protein
LISRRNSQKAFSLRIPHGTIKLLCLRHRESASKDEEGIGMNVAQHPNWQPAWTAVVAHAGIAF